MTGAIKGLATSELGWEKLETRRLFHKLIFFYKIVHCRTPSFLTGWEKLETRRLFHKLIFFYKIVHCRTPSFLTEHLPPYTYQRARFNLRSQDTFCLYPSRTERLYYSFFPSSVCLWNSLNNTFGSQPVCLFIKERYYLTCLLIPSHGFI